jgi:hypothetical protein
VNAIQYIAFRDELEKIAISKKQIHQLADKLGIPWDHDPKFMRWTGKLIGKTRLDAMTSREHSIVYKALKERGRK